MSKSKESFIKFSERKISKNEHLLLKLVFQNPRFELVKEIANQLGVNYISLVRSARRLVFEKSMLGMAFSPYRMRLDRYLVIFKLKREYEKIAASELLNMLPYNIWVKSITLTTIPMGEAHVYYLVPQGDDAEKIVESLSRAPFVADKSDIFVSKMNLTYFQRPDIETYFKEYKKGLSTLSTVLSNIEFKGLLKADKSELNDPYPRAPPDFIDALIMSMLEVRYVFTPKWLSSKGPMYMGIRRSVNHYNKHIRDKYVLGAYMRRPLDPKANTMYMFVVKGREALDLGYTLSRTPYAYVLCDISDICEIFFWIRSEDVRLVNDFIETFDIEIIKQAFREILVEERLGLTKRSFRKGFPFTNYSIKNRDWLSLDESIIRYKRNRAWIEKKLKNTKIWVYVAPELPQAAVY